MCWIAFVCPSRWALHLSSPTLCRGRLTCREYITGCQLGSATEAPAEDGAGQESCVSMAAQSSLSPSICCISQPVPIFPVAHYHRRLVLTASQILLARGSCVIPYRVPASLPTTHTCWGQAFLCFLKELQYKAHFFQPLGVESQIPKETGLLPVWGLQSYLQPPCDLYYHQPTQADFLKQTLWVRQRWRSGKEFTRRCKGRRFNP